MESVKSGGIVVWVGSGLILLSLAAGALVMFAAKRKPSLPPPPIVEPAPIVNRTVVESLGSIYVSSGPTKGKQYSIPKDGLRIGRDPDACTVVLPLETVGREHAWVMPMEDGQVAVIDRGSSNGTYVNSVDSARIKKVMLKPGDRILICHDNPIELVYQRG
jgi:S-formylglutathione hydrolase FrmB